MDSTISIHVYSIQKAEIKDSSTLYSTDYDAVRDNLKNCNKYSAIHCETAVPMSAAELELIQEIQQHSSPEKVSKSESSPHVPAAKANVKTSKGIMGMFANKATAKNLAANLEVKLERKEDTPLVEASDPKPTGMSTAVNKFFVKSTRNQDKFIKKETESSAQSSPVESNHSDLPVKMDKEMEKGREDLKAVRKHKDIRSKTKRLDLSDSDDERAEMGNQSKKRRRIKKPQSDSSDEDALAEHAVMTTGSPESQVKIETTLEVLPEVKKRKRRRVLKSKTFLDDEGCIVTEKAYESESYSENDEVETSQVKAPALSVPAKKEEGKKSAKKNSTVSNKAAKQASIMGFFQKK
ncbi:hypothetical protein ACEWY4_027901 [Coilia grayii]|uniref:DNA polymerase delta subunit 3 n=1 Tax=Coilia grayii TaxID=363190 RepID=A0ABD1IQM3_9TELE